jgi:hypothetical protein
MFAGSGLTATYFSGVDLTGASVQRIDSTINFEWIGSPVAGQQGIGGDVFSVRWTGKVVPRYSETYTFTTRSDDGVRFWIDGRLLVNNWTRHAATNNSGSIALSAGRKYQIKMEFFQQWGGATAKLFWQSPSQAFGVVPAEALFSDTASGSDGGTELPPPPAPSPPPPAGRVFYVSPAGNDKWSGTSAMSAWRTVQRVNAVDFNPGDAVLFEGGRMFAGTLAFTQEDAGTSVAPVTIGSYGQGRATIYAGDTTGLHVYNAAGFVVRGINFLGSGISRNWGDGVHFYHDVRDAKLPFVRIDAVDVSGFGRRGIAVGAWNRSAGWRDVRVTNSSLHENGDAGFATYAEYMRANEDVYVGRVRAFNNLGIKGWKQINGSGIALGQVVRGIVEYSVAHDNGLYGFNGAGIWGYDADGLVFQHNEAYRNHTAGYADGGGFDFDRNVSNSVMQYNYSHDNDGPGYLFAHSEANDLFANNVIRYNITQNDARRLNAAGIEVWGRVINSHVYNNTVFLRSSSSGNPKAIWIFNGAIPSNDVDGLYVRNNLFQTDEGVRLVEVSASQLDRSRNLRFEGNAYWSTGDRFDIFWGSASYGTVDSWRAATGQERVNGMATGLSSDPRLVGAGLGGTLDNPDILSSLAAYRLLSGSPLIDAGLTLQSMFGIAPGARDFYGIGIPRGSRYDIGAYEAV